MVPGLPVLQAAPHAEEARTERIPVLALLRELLSQLDPFALRRELLVAAPVRARVLRQPHLLERHREIEMRFGVERVQAQRLPVAHLSLGKAPEVVVDVPE